MTKDNSNLHEISTPLTVAGHPFLGRPVFKPDWQIDHIGQSVTDIEQETIQNTNMMGYRLDCEANRPEHRATVAFLAPDGDNSAPSIELLQPTSVDSPPGRFRTRILDWGFGLGFRAVSHQTA